MNKNGGWSSGTLKDEGESGCDGWLLEANRRATRVPIGGCVSTEETRWQVEASTGQVRKPALSTSLVVMLQTEDRGRVYPGCRNRLSDGSAEMFAASLGSTACGLARQEGRRLTSMSCPELGYTGKQPSSVAIELDERSALASNTARPLTAEMLQPGCRAPSKGYSSHTPPGSSPPLYSQVDRTSKSLEEKESHTHTDRSNRETAVVVMSPSVRETSGGGDVAVGEREGGSEKYPEMAYISASKPPLLKPRFYLISNPISLKSLYFFCSSAPDPPIDTSLSSTDPIPNPDPDPDPDPPVSAATIVPESPNVEVIANQRTLRGKHRNPEKLEDIICRMMANRPWTTRLQNSIRNLVPEFDHSLVYNVLHGARNSEHALQFFRWVERAGLFQHDKETHFKIIEILGRASKLNHARCILLDMPKKGVEWDEDMFVMLIDSYGKAGIVQESVKIFQKMEELGVERTIKSYDTLFKVIMRRGRYMMAKRYFNKMLSEGIMPTCHTFNLMIWGFFLSSRVETANRFFEEMKSREISPNVVTYNTMINGYHRVKKMEEAEKFFVEMKGRNIAPTVISYTTMIKGYVSVGQVDDALRLLEEMKSFGIKPNAITYSTLLPGLCDAEKMPEARNILKEMVEKYIPPKDNSIFIRLISGQCKADTLDAAADVLKAMIRLSIPTEAGHYGVLIENFCKAGVFDRAVNLLDKLIEKEVILRPQSTLEMEPSAYNPMIMYLCNNGQTAKAETFFRQLMKKGVQDPIAFNNLLRGHSTEGSPDSAFEILNIMIRRKVPSEGSAHKLLVESYLKKGEAADAKTALDSMIEQGHLPDSALYRSVMQSLFEDGRIQTASRVMNTMVEKGVKENMDLVAKILEALLLRGHVEEALGRIDVLMHSGCTPDFDNLLSVLCEKGKTIAALKLLDFGLERDFNIDFSSYDKVLDALLAAGKTLNAYSILCKVMEKGGPTDESSCKDLIKSLNEEGNTKQADILSRMMMGGDKAARSKKGKKQASIAL
ncbi:hypothetical protein HYC85_008090 [Camellia sinensis]|uniref:Pentatricopeptide repeat-containing protein-mitochondrial domain-containing protein n=1 Tax=Camellia sinensis TaxID=4442 RepID=A0A7J7HT65_CAMSI|nr:hypothetical protein HYC85_008090 [Camellia sinensis]